MNYKLTIEQASILNITKGLMESYQGTNLFKDFSESVKENIRNEYIKLYGTEKSGVVVEQLSKKYGISEPFIRKAIYETSDNRKR